MDKAKLVIPALGGHFKLSKSLKIRQTKKRWKWKKVLYCLVIESLIYAMVSSRPNITDGIGVINRSMSNPKKEH